jgi:hypothetical protein
MLKMEGIGATKTMTVTYLLDVLMCAMDATIHSFI